MRVCLCAFPCVCVCCRPLTVSGGKCCRNAQPVSLIQLTETFNPFSPLSNESESEAEPSLVSTPPTTGSETPKLPTISSDKLKTLVIDESITSIRLKMNHPAIIHCLPGGRATDVKANLKMVLTKAKTGVGSIGILLSTSAPTMLG
jgi:hypothetical protein